jgi:outer membrane immunogenic protein
MFLRDSKNDVLTTDNPLFPGTTDVRISGSFKTNYLFTAGGKLGYAFCRFLPYFTGGLAVGDSDFDGQIEVENDGGFRFRGGRTDTRVGWYVGGGLEYMITNHWRARAQYQWIDLGEVGSTREDSLGLGFISHRSVDLRENNAQFAIIYGF